MLRTSFCWAHHAFCTASCCCQLPPRSPHGSSQCSPGHRIEGRLQPTLRPKGTSGTMMDTLVSKIPVGTCVCGNSGCSR